MAHFSLSPPRAIAERVGDGSIAVTPWPHQQRAFQRLWQHWPPKLLIVDEGGLGKTVQAGLMLRQAWCLSSRCVISTKSPAATCPLRKAGDSSTLAMNRTTRSGNRSGRS